MLLDCLTFAPSARTPPSIAEQHSSHLRRKEESQQIIIDGTGSCDSRLVTAPRTPPNPNPSISSRRSTQAPTVVRRVSTQHRPSWSSKRIGWVKLCCTASQRVRTRRPPSSLGTTRLVRSTPLPGQSSPGRCKALGECAPVSPAFVAGDRRSSA